MLSIKLLQCIYIQLFIQVVHEAEITVWFTLIIQTDNMEIVWQLSITETVNKYFSSSCQH